MTVPIRLRFFGRSLWLDESWVANSVLAPTLHGMFVYDRVPQTTPPLFLLLLRGWVAMVGFAEPALRVIPGLAYAASVLFFAILARRIFRFPLAFAAATFLALNYTVITEAQQVKQYTTDLLTAIVLILLAVAGAQRGIGRGLFVAVVAISGIALFLSYPSVFFLPATALVIVLHDWRRQTLWQRLTRPLIFVLVTGLLFGIEYLAFIRPNATGTLTRVWAQSELGSLSLLEMLRRSATAWHALVLPPPFGWPRLVLAVSLVGAMRMGLQALRGARLAQFLGIAGFLPLVGVVILSLTRRYPVLEPRLTIWLLPFFILILFYGIESVAELFLRSFPGVQAGAGYALVAGCLLGAGFTEAYLTRTMKPSEGNRPAIALIREQALPGDCIFVHAAMWEQFDFYRKVLHWSPGCVYWGDVRWFSAKRNTDLASTPHVGLARDVNAAVARAGAHRLWMLLPVPAPEHWTSIALRDEILATGALPRREGCAERVATRFDLTQVYMYDCAAATPLAR